MARYIDANLLLQQVAHINSTVEQGVKYFNSVYNLIQKQPIADVVEVVRCKDCKYGEVDDTDFPNQYLCNHSGCDWNEGNHFCGYGERRDT